LLPRLVSFSFLPLTFALLQRLLTEARARFFLGFILAGAMVIWGGDLEMLGRGMTAALMLMVLSVFFFRPAPALLLKRFLLYLFGLAVLSLLGLNQLLPTLELIAQSSRRTALNYMIYSFNSGLIASFPLLVHIAANPLFYIGLFSGWIMARKDRWILPCYLLFFLFLFMSLNLSDILRLFYKVPLFNRFHWHTYMTYFSVILLAALVGKAIDYFRSPPVKGWTAGLFSLLFFAGWLTPDLVAIFFFKAPATFSPWYYPLKLSLIGLAAVGTAAVLLLRRDARSRSPAIIAFVAPALVYTFLVSFMIAGIWNAAPVPRDSTYSAIVLGLDHQYRVINLTNRNFQDRLAISTQAGILDHGQTFDFHFSMLPQWSCDFLCLLKPFWLCSEKDDTQGLSLQIYDMFKQGDFLDSDNLKYLNFLNLGLLATDHENFKFTPRYQIAYMVRPHDCHPGGCRPADARSSPSGRPEVSVPAPGYFHHRIYIPQEAKLNFGLFYPQHSLPPAPLHFQIIVWDESSQQMDLVFSRASPTTKHTPIRHEYLISLSKWAQKTVNLVFLTMPDGGEGNGLMAGAWLDPVIVNDRSPFTRIASSGDVNLYWNQDVLPRAMFVHRAKVIQDKATRLEYMKSPAFDPSQEVILEQEPRQSLSGHSRSSLDEVKIREYRDNSLWVEVKASEAGILVLSETYFQGWKAWEDGREIPILRANHAFRGIELPRGLHSLKLVYRPYSLRIGIDCALATFMLVFFYFILVKRRGSIVQTFGRDYL
jgi:hypothetical protein